MTVFDIPRMFVSSHGGWDELERVHPSVIKLFLLLVLPFSLVPPAMIEYAGLHYGSRFFPGAEAGSWAVSAAVFFVAELVTVPLMAWAIKSNGETRKVRIPYHDAFTIAAVAAIPLWVSALGLFVPNLAFVVTLAMLGLIGAISLVYHGIEAVLHMHEELEVASLTFTTLAIGILAWAGLLVLIFMPLLLL
ncbi:Yip1 family protein [Marinobacterium aestuariivivens]|uniref:Yip1 family protein n=1 Tax=Marinobacterium aestuariivivens TaxID=1698799 RepID=A0ABW2A4K1_9GAMM